MISTSSYPNNRRGETLIVVLLSFFLMTSLFILVKRYEHYVKAMEGRRDIYLCSLQAGKLAADYSKNIERIDQVLVGIWAMETIATILYPPLALTLNRAKKGLFITQHFLGIRLMVTLFRYPYCTKKNAILAILRIFTLHKRKKVVLFKRKEPYETTIRRKNKLELTTINESGLDFIKLKASYSLDSGRATSLQEL